MNLKQHFKDNKKFYNGLGTGIVIAGITTLIMRNQQLFSGRLHDQRSIADVYTTKMQTTVGSSFVFGNNNTVTNTMNVGENRLSYICSCVIDGVERWFKSQAELAEATGHTECNISKHLNHGVPLSDGLQVTRHGIST
jgi:hypothetical protein